MPFPLSILLISHDRVADVGEMHAYLMLSACQELHLQQGKPFRFLKHLVSRMGQSPFAGSVVVYTTWALFSARHVEIVASLSLHLP